MMALMPKAETSFSYRSRESVHEAVRQYFARKTLTGEAIESGWRYDEDGPPRVQRILTALGQEERLSRCGCGLPFPDLLSGERVLDMGCGAGSDCLVLSQLVGKAGCVVGVDLCPELVATARRFASDRGDERVKFVCADVAMMAEHVKVTSHAPFSVAVANCAFSLIAEKAAALSEVARLMATGGELYICDVFVSHDVTDCMRNNAFAWTKCIGGAWRWEEFSDVLSSNGFSQPRMVEHRPLEIGKELLQEIAKAFGLGGMTDDLRSLQAMSGFQLCAATYRAFKLPESVLGDLSEGSLAKTRVTFSPPQDSDERQFRWDEELTFRASQPTVVSGEVATILQHSRYARYFLFSSAIVGATSVASEANANPFQKSTSTPQVNGTSPHSPGPTAMNGVPRGLHLSSPSRSPVIPRCSGGTCRRGAMALSGLANLNGSASTELTALLRSSPALQNLRDMVAKQGIRGCGNGAGCD